MSDFFTDKEVAGLDRRLVAMLDVARRYAGIPFIITSGLRTADQNAVVGGVSDSSHLQGQAVDLAVRSSSDAYKIIGGLYRSGFDRIGLYFRDNPDGTVTPSHIHADISLTLLQNVFFLKRERAV